MYKNDLVFFGKIRQQTVTTLTSLFMIVVSFFLILSPFFLTHTALAAALTDAKDTLSSSAPGISSNHTIEFVTPTGVAAGETIQVALETGFTIPGSLDFTDVDLAENGSDEGLAGSCSGATWGVAVVPGSRTITFTSCTGTIAPGATTTIEIGTNATFGTNGDQQITNPVSTGTYFVTVSGTMSDSATVRVAIIESVAASASVGISFTFSISGVADGQVVNGSATTTATTTTPTSIPFEILSPNSSKVLAQDLSVSTNAANGFVVTIIEAQNITSSGGADIDLFIDGASTSVPVSWTAPSANPANENTFGHFGITSEDADLNGDEFGTDLWAGNIDNARQVFSSSGPADGVTANIGQTRVGFQIEISALQEAGEDYTTTLTYVATPTF